MVCACRPRSKRFRKVKGVEPGGVTLSDEIKDELQAIADTKGTCNYQNLAGTALATYLNQTTDPTWDGFEHAFTKMNTDLNFTRKLSDSHFGSHHSLNSISNAYRGIVWRDFSMDLVAASLRQRKFTNRIIHECHDLDTTDGVSNAISRYRKFLLLMRKKDTITGKHIPLVPTLDIDLAWHTHQLFPHAYHDWCLQHIGRKINHDDTFGKGTIRDGLRSTSLAWLDEYGESYTTSVRNTV
jgi:hypothetical protein